MKRFRIFLLCSCFLAIAGGGWAVSIRVLATGDMHGALQSQPTGGQQLGGAAEMLAYWKHNEAEELKGCLVLGCGDANSGSPLANLFKGDPVVTVMDLMGYDACALGAHDFDFGREQLDAWGKLADFPFLAANLKKADGNTFELAVPYTIVEKQGVKIGIVGLMTKNLLKLTDRAAGLKVIPYTDALISAVPAARKAGAQVVIVVAHVPQTELLDLAREVPELQIPLMLGGESHDVAINKVGRTWVVSSGQNWQSYARVTLEVTGERAIVQNAQVVWLQQTQPEADKGVAGAIAAWQQKMQAMMATPVGTASAVLPKGSDGLYNFVDDCMLEGDAKAQIAFTNYGSLRTDLPAGQVTVGDIYKVLPFNDSIYRVTISGAQLVGYFHEIGGKVGMAGLRMQDGQYQLTKTGQPLDPDATYQVLVNNFMYEQSPLLQAADALPTSAFADWRQPLLEWFAKHPSSTEKPFTADTQPRMGQ